MQAVASIAEWGHLDHNVQSVEVDAALEGVVPFDEPPRIDWVHSSAQRMTAPYCMVHKASTNRVRHSQAMGEWAGGAVSLDDRLPVSGEACSPMMVEGPVHPETCT